MGRMLALTRAYLTALIAAVACLLPIGCGHSAPYVWATQLPRSAGDAIGTLRPGDRVQVVVYGQDAMSGEFEVRPRGELVLPTVGSVMAAGRGTQEVAADVANRLRGLLASPLVTIVIASRRPASVGVMGEVKTPGRYELREGEGVLDALTRSGGLTEFANADALFVVRRNQATARIRFRYRDLVLPNTTSARFQLRDGDIVIVE